jgi:hypothetical protein
MPTSRKESCSYNAIVYIIVIFIIIFFLYRDAFRRVIPSISGVKGTGRLEPEVTMQELQNLTRGKLNLFTGGIYYDGGGFGMQNSPQLAGPIGGVARSVNSD